MIAPEPRAAEAAVRVGVTGVVQGVGFRPFVHRLALRHELAGWIRNEAGGVEILLEGDPDGLRVCLEELRSEAPPLARLERVEAFRDRPSGLADFTVRESTDDPDRRQPVSPDVATCDACLEELEDPDDRRHAYPFNTCTDCGPRYTIIEAMPYDRERTSMRAFPPCPACREEYARPGDRRYRSETNSCPTCGPRLWAEAAGSPAGEPRSPEASASPAGDPGDDRQAALDAAARALRQGAVVAVRGLGGFHLAVDATDDAAVRRLRRRKRRDAKPLAVMVRDLEAARSVAAVDADGEALLTAPERPVVLLRRRTEGPLAPSVAPGLDTVGVMLPYTPLHRLLLARAGRPLVMTSGNLSDEPIATGIGEARERLSGIADLFLLHDRAIVARCDDSVVRPAADGTRIVLRRARGMAPLPLDLPVPSPVPLVAVGPHLKNTFTLVHGGRAWPSPHVGDLEDLETLEHFRGTLARMQELHRIRPVAGARDLHSGYLSTREAEALGLDPLLAVQHHHAHVAAVAAEHGLEGAVAGLAFDGTGQGEDGRVWGAEGLVADLRGYRRVARLRYAPLPGGELAVRTPWRTALGYLVTEGAAPGDAFGLAFRGVEPRELEVARKQAEGGLNAPEASSMGRLFDAAAAVLGVRRRSDYEGQAPMELEALAGDRPAFPLPFPVRERDGTLVMDPLPLLLALDERVRSGGDPADLAAAFHESVAAAAVRVARAASETAGTPRVALGGGCFQNARLTAAVRRGLEEIGLEPLLPRALGPGDGAISYGQAAVAAALLHDGTEA